ncbi:MAG: prepilin-type N-terminal cleavage/methylation domain-containing protein [Betaproteobacteria bacterium]
MLTTDQWPCRLRPRIAGIASHARGKPGIARRQWISLRAGFTLIELLVVMAIIALLLTIAVPRYWKSTDKAKEAVLKQDLAHMRVAIDQFHADRGKYPESIGDLVDKKYLKAVPRDPMTESAQTWVVVPPPDPATGSIYDIKSGAVGTAIDGRSYSEW